MWRFLLAELRHRRTRTLSLSLGVLVAALSFTLLTAAISTGQLRLKGTIEHNFRADYDILVRPPDSYTSLERTDQLVSANFASGIFGGITVRQWHQILSIPGVEVAAPIANLGYVAPFIKMRIPIDRFLNRDPVQLYRLAVTWSADRGLSRYPGPVSFVYFTRVDEQVTPRYTVHDEVLPNGRRIPVCSGFYQGLPLPGSSPFFYSTRAAWFIQCFSGRSPRAARGNIYPFPPGGVGSGTDVLYPELVAAIDPRQEAALLGVPNAVVSGRFLKPGESVGGPPGDRVIPVLASSRNYLDASLDVSVQRLQIPSGADVPRTLASARAFRFLTRLDGPVTGHIRGSSRFLFHREMGALTRRAGGLQNYWSVGNVNYRGTAVEGLQPITVRNPADAYALPCCGPTAAPGNQDVQFRRLANHKRHYVLGAPLSQFRFDVVGRFDPELIQTPDEPSRVPLGAYSPPVLQPVNAASRRLLGDRPLLPSTNLGGYIQQPPTVLTTLQSLRFFLNPSNFEEGDRGAPISVIRVRVAGVTGPDDLSLARIRSVAQLIRQRTGLAVDIVAGSSPSPVLIDLPAGKYGRPQLLLREAWVKKGVAVTIIRALDRKSLFLFLLVLLVTGLFLANGALAAVRSRRREIGTLRSLGWSSSRVFQAILGELALVGFIAGLVGTGLALLLIRVFSLHLSVIRALGVTPIGTGLACVAGFVPAWRAGRTEPMGAIRPPISLRASTGSVRHVAGVAFANLRRLPARTIVGAGGLFVGVAALTVLLAINFAFRGVLVGSLLGNVISVQVRGVDLLSVVLAMILSGLSVADVLVLNIRERAAEIVTLRATGWGNRQLGTMVAFEGAWLGLLGSVPGAVVGIGIAWAAGVVSVQTVLAGAAAIGIATGIALGASIVPAALLVRMLVPAVLAEE